jgi:hypothetical protein
LYAQFFLDIVFERDRAVAAARFRQFLQDLLEMRARHRLERLNR